jgi:outer membrane receptor protein involved in Fe transport
MRLIPLHKNEIGGYIVKKFKRNPLSSAISLTLTGSAVAAMVVAPAHAQDESGAYIDEIVVSAQKRDQSLQDVAVSIQVLGNQQLEDLNVRGFEDFVDFGFLYLGGSWLCADLHARHRQWR